MTAVSTGVFVDVLDGDGARWKEQIRLAEQLEGCDHIEVWLEDVEAAERHLGPLAELLHGRRVLVHAPFVGVSVASAWADLRRISLRRLERAIDVAAKLGARVLTVHPGEVLTVEPQAAVLDRVATAYEQLREKAASTGARMSVAVENMPARAGAKRDSVASIADFGALLERVPAMRFTLDIGHAVQNGESYAGFMKAHREAIVNIHLHDALTGGRGHLPLGAGVLDLPGFLAALREARYEGFVSFETLGPQDTRASWNSFRALAAGRPSTLDTGS